MKKFALVLLSVFILCCTTYLVKAESTKSAHKYLSYEQILKQDKPAVILFESNDCSFCVQFAPIYKALSKEFEAKFAFGQVDVYKPKYEKLCEDLNIETIPMIFVYNPTSQNFSPIPQFLYGKNSLRKILTEYHG